MYQLHHKAIGGGSLVFIIMTFQQEATSWHFAPYKEESQVMEDESKHHGAWKESRKVQAKGNGGYIYISLGSRLIFIERQAS